MESGGAEPWPGVSTRGVGVDADRRRGNRVGHRRVQGPLGFVKLVSGSASKPLVELRQEPEHPLRGDPLGLCGEVDAETGSPLHVAEAMEPGMDGIDRRRAEREIRRYGQGDAFAIAKRQASRDTRIVRAVEGDIDAQAGAGGRFVVDADDPDGGSVGGGDASELGEGRPLPFTQCHDRIRPRRPEPRRHRQRPSAHRSWACLTGCRRHT